MNEIHQLKLENQAIVKTESLNQETFKQNDSHLNLTIDGNYTVVELLKKTYLFLVKSTKGLETLRIYKSGDPRFQREVETNMLLNDSYLVSKMTSFKESTENMPPLINKSVTWNSYSYLTYKYFPYESLGKFLDRAHTDRHELSGETCRYLCFKLVKALNFIHN